MAVLALLCASLVMGGCGFHLRDAAPISAQVRQIHLASVNPFGDLMRKLRRRLEIAGVDAAADATTAEWLLTIDNEKNTRRALTTTSLITVAEYELLLEVEFRLARGDGKVAIPPTTLTARRIYVLDRTSLAGSSEEEELLKGEMQDEVVATILRRVAAVTSREGGADDTPAAPG